MEEDVDTYSLYYALFNGSAVPVTKFFNGLGSRLNIAVDGQGAPCIAFSSSSGTESDIFFSYALSQPFNVTQSREPIGFNDGHPTIAIDNNGLVHLAYGHNTEPGLGGAVSYTHKQTPYSDVDDFIVPVRATPLEDGVVYQLPRLAIDDLNVHIAYRRYEDFFVQPRGRTDCYYTRLDRNDLQTPLSLSDITRMSLVTDVNLPSGNGPGIGTSSNGLVHISWIGGFDAQGPSSWELYYATVDNGLVSPATQITVNNVRDAYPVLALETDGTAHISYLEAASDVWYATNAATLPDNDPPVISNIHEENVTTNSADIVWDTNESATSIVRFGTSSGSYTNTGSESALVSGHRMALTGLTANTTYFYQVESADASENTSISGEFSFATLASGADMISSINLTSKVTGPWTRAVATIIVASNGSPVSGAAVDVTWSFSNSDQGTTDSNGQVVFESIRTKNKTWSFTITIDDITKVGFFWNTGSSEIWDTITYLSKRNRTTATAPSRPETFALEQNHPNPFNPETIIRFAHPKASHVEITIYNTRGQAIRRLVSTVYSAGEHSIKWDGRDQSGNSVSSGVYLYEIQAGSFRAVKKMSLLR